ncbi:hypothetical protein FHK92_19555 [Pseudomonas brassicacearum subsp. neoaurantiaca]|uniref:Uncharacterized protein n=1 Tax=Pseudomonas brassicacearum subsp. neoaurantiaca TaxID=494916 RepID=A0A7V8UEA3_9PSED|nr:hypothetical protein [Pseudomonas brassicacearum subsp. neoaurantiaca]
MLKLGLGEVFQQLFAVGLQVRQQIEDLSDVVPQLIQSVFKATQLSLLQRVVAIQETAFGMLLPQRLKLFPLGFQPTFELADRCLIRGIQRLDMTGRDIWKKADAVTLAAIAFGYFQNAAGADDVWDGIAKRFFP